MTTGPTEAGVIAELAVKAAGAPGLLTDPATGRKFLFHPSDLESQEIHEVDEHGNVLAAPCRIIQKVTLQTVDSLVDYVDRFKEQETTLFADVDTSTIVAVIDYHGGAAGDDLRGGRGDADHLDHRATLQLKHSVEWKTWNEVSGKMMTQLEFARFLEENAADVTKPSGADLLEVARDLQAVRSADFKRVVRTSGEDESFEYSESVEARTKGGSIEVPTKFQLGVPVYFGDATTELYAFLRWNLNDGKLQLGAKLHRPEHVRQAVFQEIVMDVGSRTGCPVVFGKLG